MKDTAKELNGISIRLPLDLYQWLQHRAVVNERSLNKEVLTILKQAREREDGRSKNL